MSLFSFFKYFTGLIAASFVVPVAVVIAALVVFIAVYKIKNSERNGEFSLLSLSRKIYFLLSLLLASYFRGHSVFPVKAMFISTLTAVT